MTEYDYSPEAYERYLDTQHRISRWVDNTEAHAHEFKAPFGARSDVDSRDIAERNEAGASIPRGGSAGEYYRARHGHGDPARDIPRTSAAAGMPAAPAPQQHPFYAPMPVRAQGPFVPYPAPHMGAGYPPPPQLTSPPVSPPQQIVIQTYPKKHHSSHHHGHHDHQSSRKPKSKTRTYIIQPTPSQSYPYPVGAAPAYSGYPYPDSSTHTSPTAYHPSHYAPGSQIYSPPGAIMNPSHLPQPAVPSNYVIIPPKGRNVRVIYA